MDKIEQFDQALIHHGKFNDRMFVLKFPEEGGKKLVKKLVQKAIELEYSKIICKAPRKLLPVFLSSGFKIESTIPKFFKGKEDCCFVSRFLEVNRAVFDPGPLTKFREVLENYEYKSSDPAEPNYNVRVLNHQDIDQMAAVFAKVFPTYPFPIQEHDYIRKTMNNNVVYYGVLSEEKLLCISSAEIDEVNQNAEMTDFAVLPSARGKGLSKLLLKAMEADMKKKEFKTLYTIARLNSIPMNKTFLGAGYSYAGTLVNNTNISGAIESMNIFYKYI